MTLLISAEDVKALATPQVALDAMRTGFKAEAEGRTHLPVRVDSDSSTGFLRVMPAVLDSVMGLKVMTLVAGLGTRYLVLLYSVETGEVLAVVDADELTRIRTAATTLLAGMHMVDHPPEQLAVIGTGFEARGHLAMIAQEWRPRSVHVYSRSEQNRQRFAAAMAEQVGIDVIPTAGCREALQSADTVLLATKSSAAVIDGRDLRPGSVVLSIGSTRPDLREIDEATLERAAVLVVDSKSQVLHESGDIIAAVASGALPTSHIVALADLCLSDRVLPRAHGTRDITVFKSAGTALQDLALARSVHTLAVKNGSGRDVGEISSLKPFT